MNTLTPPALPENQDQRSWYIPEPESLVFLGEGHDAAWNPELTFAEHKAKASEAFEAFEADYALPSDSRLKIAHALLLAAGYERGVLLAGETGSGKSFAAKRMVGNGKYTLDVQPDTREAAVKGFVSPMTDRFMPGGLRSGRLILDELGHAQNTAGVNTVFQDNLRINGEDHALDARTIAVAATTNFPENGFDRVNPLDSATLGRYAAYILMGDGDKEKARRLRRLIGNDSGTDLSNGSIPAAETRARIGELMDEIAPNSNAVVAEEERIIDRIFDNEYLYMLTEDDARLYRSLWRVATAARFAGITGVELADKELYPKEVQLVAPLVLPKSVKLSEKGLDKLGDHLNTDPKPIQEQIALRQTIAALVHPGSNDKNFDLPAAAFARDDRRAGQYRSFVDQVTSK